MFQHYGAQMNFYALSRMTDLKIHIDCSIYKHVDLIRNLSLAITFILYRWHSDENSGSPLLSRIDIQATDRCFKHSSNTFIQGLAKTPGFRGQFWHI